MTSHFIRSIPKLALAALFAITTAGSIVATDATHPAENSAIAGVNINVNFQDGYVDPGWRGGRWHGRFYQHRRWHAGFYGPYHRFHPGYWVYF